MDTQRDTQHEKIREGLVKGKGWTTERILSRIMEVNERSSEKGDPLYREVVTTLSSTATQQLGPAAPREQGVERTTESDARIVGERTTIF